MFATKIESAAFSTNAAEISIKCKASIATLVAFLGKYFALKLTKTQKAAMANIPACTSFINFFVPIYKEIRSYGELIMMSIPAYRAIHVLIPFTVEHFIYRPCEGIVKKISDSFGLRHN